MSADFPSLDSPNVRRSSPAPDELAQRVAGVMTAWRAAIQQRDPETVTRLDLTFRDAPERYEAALVESAKSDADERVRAFSTRVLGKLRLPELADTFRALLADPSPYVRQNAAWALGELAGASEGRAPNRAALASLERLRASDPDGDVRAEARSALERLR